MSDPQVHAFSYAQPAILSRDTVRFMQSALHANGLTELQALWGGTHDALLGLLLFAFDVNVFSFKHSYDTQYFYKASTQHCTLCAWQRGELTASIYTHRLAYIRPYSN